MRVASEHYLEKARRLTPDETEQVLARIKRKWTRLMEDKTVLASFYRRVQELADFYESGKANFT